MDAKQIKEQTALYFASKCYAVADEIALNDRATLRADLLCMNMREEFVIVEVKSSYADFRSDKKWWNYVDYAHKLYFAVTDKLYEKIFDLIPKGIGIIVIDSVSGWQTVKQPAKRRELDAQTKINLMKRMVFRNSDFNRVRRKRAVQRT